MLVQVLVVGDRWVDGGPVDGSVEDLSVGRWSVVGRSVENPFVGWQSVLCRWWFCNTLFGLWVCYLFKINPINAPTHKHI